MTRYMYVHCMQDEIAHEHCCKKTAVLRRKQ